MVLRKSEYRIWIVLFGLIIRIPNTIPNSIQNFGKRQLKSTYLVYTRHPDRYPDRYLNTRILFRVPKKPNTEYRILFGIEIIRIPNRNTTIWSNCSNKIQIPNYLSHPETKWLSWFVKGLISMGLPRLIYFSITDSSVRYIPPTTKYKGTEILKTLAHIRYIVNKSISSRTFPPPSLRPRRCARSSTRPLSSGTAWSPSGPRRWPCCRCPPGPGQSPDRWCRLGSSWTTIWSQTWQISWLFTHLCWLSKKGP